MTASLHRLGAGSAAGLYYTNDAAREARPDKRDEYYLAEGGGIWWSTGESVVRHGAVIEAASFRDLCAGRDPASHKPLVRGAGEGHWAGQDMTLTPGKSVSVLWMAGDVEQRAAIEQAHRAAVERALAFVAAEALVVVRTGAGGAQAHRPSDLIVARFDHFTTREGDPNLHCHCVFLNVAGAPANASYDRYKRLKNLTIDPDRLYEYQRAVGATYRAALAEDLQRRFGFRYRAAGQGQWEIAGVPAAVLEAFSKRSGQILAKAGPGATSAQREIAALATRQGKEALPTGPELEARWRIELAALAVDPWAAARRPEPTPDPALAQAREREAERAAIFDPPEIAGDTPVARAASRLLRHESVISRKDLLQRALEEASLQGLGIAAVEVELAALERDGVLVPLAAAEHVPGHSACWTTPGIAACEAAMLRAAARLQERSWIRPTAVEAALARAGHLSPEQGAAVRQAANADGVAILEAGAGTGKTTTAQALVDAAQSSNLTVIGLAPSWVAADELSRATGIPAQALARWRFEQARMQDLKPSGERTPDKDAQLDADTLVIVDEAGMVATRDLEAVLSAARAAGAKVILVGDRRQLASVGGASALRAVAEVTQRSGVLTEVRRQAVAWQRAASIVMARGDAEAGLRAYAAHDRVELVSGPGAAEARVIALWQEQRAAHGEDVLMVTRRNQDAAALNALARAVLRQEGSLGPDRVSLSSLDRTDRPVPLSLAVGDRLRFGETLPHLSVRNGHRAVVLGIVTEPDGSVRLRLQLEDGRVLDEPWQRLAREPRFSRKPTPPKVVYSYAGTAYAAQGRTSEAAILYLARSTDAREVYVGLTRHRQAAHVVVERERLDALCRQRQADPRIAPTHSALLERLFREARQYHEKANVIDYVADRIAFLRDGILVRSDGTGSLDVTRAVRAARALRAALAWLGVDQLITPAWRLFDGYGRRLARPLSARQHTLTEKLAAHSGRSRPGRHRQQDLGPDR